MQPVTIQSSSFQMDIIDPLADPNWDRDVVSHPDYTFFHSAAWAKVLKKTYGHQPVYLRFSRAGDLAALLPIMDVRSLVAGRRGVSLPFTDFCGPLIFRADSTEFVVSKLYEIARERKWKHFEIREFGASDESVQELRGSNMVMWEGIRFLARSGVESLHFGRTSLGNDGLRRFKLTWGTKEETIGYLKFDTAREAWVAGRDAASGFHNAVFGRLPLALNRLAGAIIYPHLD
jgi:hypothetical protein